MDVASQDWLIALAFAIIGGGLVGWVSGNRTYRQGDEITPILRSRIVAWLFMAVGIALIGLEFTVGVWQGVVSLILGFIANWTVSSRIDVGDNGRFGRAAKITIFLLIIVCLPLGSYQYNQYRRTPNESDKLAFIYGCSDYVANDIFKGNVKGDTGNAKSLCYCLWPDLVGRYHTIGAINEEVKDGDSYKFGGTSSDMYNTCVKEKYNDSI